ncbi:MAG: DUF4129 domain-containing protein [Caldilineaceae bacterium]|nr:DUF4129 domain-containing protein [Caldilineaceae bacterium]
MSERFATFVMESWISAAARGMAIVLLGCATLLAGPHPARTQDIDSTGAALTLVEYTALLERAEAALRNAPDENGMAAARAILAEATWVELPAGKRITLAPLLPDENVALSSTGGRQRLAFVRRQIEAAVNDRTAERLAVLQQLLADARFQQSESLLDQLRRWLAETFRRMLPKPDPTANTAPAAETTAEVVGWVTLAIGAVALLWLLTVWLQNLLRSFVNDAERQDPNAANALPATASQARQQAGQYARAGDYRAAVRQLYLSALLSLQERRLVSRDQSLTNRELLARVPDGHPIRPSLQTIVQTFDDIWYGVHEPDRVRYDAYRHTIEALDRAAQEVSRRET